MSKCADDQKGDLRRPWLLTLALLAFATAGAANLHANGRLKVVVAGNHQAVGQLVKVRVTNAGNARIAVCMVCCGSIIDAKADPVVPDFDVQIQGPRGWGSQLWGCDVGSCFAPSTLAAGQAQEFRLKLIEPGRYRLRLYYVADKDTDAKGPKSVKCPNIADAKHHKEATSNIFVVSGKAQ